MLVSVLRFEGAGDAFLRALHPYNGQERHHLLLDDERVLRVGFGEEELGAGRDVDSRGLG